MPTWITLLIVLKTVVFLVEGSDCTLSQGDVDSLLDSKTRIWTLGETALEKFSIQSVVDCMIDGDTLDFETENEIQPPNRIKISQSITIGHVTNPKTSITCPEGNGLFRIQCTSVTFTHLSIQNCELKASHGILAMIETQEGCSSSSVIQFLDVVFEKNVNLKGSIGIQIQDIASYSVEMDKVTYQSNKYQDSMKMGVRNTLTNLNLSKNVFNGMSFTPVSFFDFPETSENAVSSLMAEDNEGTLLRATKGVLKLTDSSILLNFDSSDGPVVVVESDLVVTNSFFDSNFAKHDGGAVLLQQSSGDFENVTFSNNTAASHAGAVSAVEPKYLRLHSTLFESNLLEIMTTASSGYAAGALCVTYRMPTSASFEITDSIFRNNDAMAGSGAILLYRLSDAKIRIENCQFSGNQGTYGMRADYSGGLMLNSGRNIEMTMKDVEFDGNFGLRGGGLGIVQTSGKAKLENLQFRNNRAVGSSGEGGGFLLSSSTDIRVDVINSTFLKNVADNNGGGINQQISRTMLRLENVEFEKNQARFGGGFFGQAVAELSAENITFDGNKADQKGGALSLNEIPSKLQFKQIAFLNNRANSGGAVFCGSRMKTKFEQCHFESNQAAEHGGAFFSSEENNDETREAMFIDCTFFSNEATSGGALYLDSIGETRIEENCQLKNNKAAKYGGAMFCRLTPNDEMFIQKTIFDKNKASGGGGAFIQVVEAENNKIVIKETSFTRNHAEQAGGGFFVDDISVLDIDCDLNIPELPLESEDSVQTTFQCDTFTKNTIGKDGYGANIATASESFLVSLLFLDGSKTLYQPGQPKDPLTWKAGSQLPTFVIIMIDYFRQGPALSKRQNAVSPCNVANDADSVLSDTIYAILSSLDTLFYNQLVTNVASGKNNITVGGLFAAPDTYSLLVWIETDPFQTVEIKVHFRECIVNEEYIYNNTLCVDCDANHYNFNPKKLSCQDCPENCNCTTWGIFPENGYWMHSPCSSKAFSCLSDDSCIFDGRKKGLENFFRDNDPSCDLNSTQLETFQQHQCAQGYEGVLCGSCQTSYGQYDLSCVKCKPQIFIILFLAGSMIWTLFASAISIFGTLSEIDLEDRNNPSGSDISNEPRQPSVENIGSEIQSSLSLPLMEDPVVSPGLDPGLDPTLAEQCDEAKRNITEIFKTFLNFAQVNGMALAINAGWTGWLKGTLELQNYASSVTVETAISFDCLFSKSSHIPRSISRVVITLMLPFVVLGMGFVYWFILIPNNRSVLFRRLVLSIVVVFYISFIGWTEKLTSVLNCVSIETQDSNGMTFHGLYWTEDTDVKCFQGSHAVLTWLLVLPMILVVIFVFPIATTTYLLFKKKRGQLDSIDVKERYGFMYGAYTENCVYWDCIILIRKAAMAFIVVFGVTMGSNMQGLVAVSTLIFCLYLQMRFMPFREMMLNRAEVFSLLVSIFTFIAGLFLHDPMITSVGKMFVTSLAILFIFAFAVYFLYMLHRAIVMFFRVTLRARQVDVRGDLNDVQVIRLWLKHRPTKLQALFLSFASEIGG